MYGVRSTKYAPRPSLVKTGHRAKGKNANVGQEATGRRESMGPSGRAMGNEDGQEAPEVDRGTPFFDSFQMHQVLYTRSFPASVAPVQREGAGVNARWLTRAAGAESEKRGSTCTCLKTQQVERRFYVPLYPAGPWAFEGPPITRVPSTRQVLCGLKQVDQPHQFRPDT